MRITPVLCPCRQDALQAQIVIRKLSELVEDPGSPDGEGNTAPRPPPADDNANRPAAQDSSAEVGELIIRAEVGRGELITGAEVGRGELITGAEVGRGGTDHWR